MARQKHVVDLREYYDIDQAAERLSANSGRPISKDYPRMLARKGHIRSFEFGAQGKMYLKADVDRYVVSVKRGRKPKQLIPA